MDEYRKEINKRRRKYNILIEVLLVVSFLLMLIAIIFNDIFHVAISYIFLILAIIVNIIKGDVERVFSVAYILKKINKVEEEVKKLKEAVMKKRR